MKYEHYCPDCGHELDEDATLDVGCEHCGTEW